MDTIIVLAMVLDQFLEVGGVGDEVGLAVDLDHRAHAALIADVGAHDALGGYAALLLGGGSQALFAQVVDGLGHVALGIDQRLLQSIMPAPVDSRSSLTIAAVMFIGKTSFR